mmetsp:Transcript_5879/g.7498  ORF Transcript_5879/g.7498 Transcript_5879/m.7498 type:complete len:392 (-) Transcript_5879:596-1771(-)
MIILMRVVFLISSMIRIVSCLPTPKPQRNLLIFGNGNVAQSVIKHATKHTSSSSVSFMKTNNNEKDYDNWLSNFFDSIICTYHTNPPSNKIRGVRYIPFETETIVNLLKNEPCITHVCMTIPPQMKQSSDNDASSLSFQDVVLDSNIREALPAKLSLAFISTTGVYGNHDGGWVDECSELKCKEGTKAHAYFNIENQWKKLMLKNDDEEIDRNVFIFRCSGLYGINFSALHTVRKLGWDTNTKNEEGTKEGDEGRKEMSYTSRIHLDDVGRAIIACMMQTEMIHEDNSDENYIFNLSDNVPATRNQVMMFANNLLKESNISNSPHEANDMNMRYAKLTSERGKRRNKDRKRVSNKKIRRILEPYGGLKFPSFREGLKDILECKFIQWREDI